MKSIRRSHVEAWIKVIAANWAPTTVKTRFVIVRSVFRAAVSDRIIANDPSTGVALPRRRKADVAMRVPTVEEVGVSLSHADSARVSTRKGFRAYVALCAFAGPRKGEAAAVQVGDIDFLRRQLTVSRQLQRDGGSYVVRPPKYGSERLVYLPDDLVRIIGEHVTKHLPDAEPGALAVHRRGRADLRQRDHLAVACDQDCGQAAALRLHDLRHFYASGLIADGCDVVTVQRALGHSTATTTLNTYSHLWPTAEDRTRKAAAGLLRQALASRVGSPQSTPVSSTTVHAAHLDLA